VQQLYAFRDKGDRDVALAARNDAHAGPDGGGSRPGAQEAIRWFSLPQLFRYERQQRGRLREHFQLNMDIIGEAGPLADAELIAAAIDIMACVRLRAEGCAGADLGPPRPAGPALRTWRDEAQLPAGVRGDR